MEVFEKISYLWAIVEGHEEMAIDVFQNVGQVDEVVIVPMYIIIGWIKEK